MRNDIIRRTHHTRGVGWWHCSECETLIENYEAAKADNFKNWVLHHRRETHLQNGERMLADISAEDLNTLDMYKNRPASELIYMTIAEHSRLHQKGKKISEEAKKKISDGNKGKRMSEEAKQKMSEAQKGEKNSFYGKHHTEEALKKNSEATTERNIGRHWYHNDKDNFFCYECPPGCEPGMLKRK